MKILLRIIAVLLFIVFFGFAMKNTQEISLQFFLGYEMRGRLVLLLLGFFVGGAALGVLAMTPTLFRHRRELAKHKKTIATIQKEVQEQAMVKSQPPQPDAVIHL